MSNTGGSWTAVIPGVSVGAPGLEYFVTATDGSSNANTTVFPATPWFVSVQVPDTQGPSIAHAPQATPQMAGNALAVTATITDASAVAGATLYFRRAGDTSWLTSAMTASGGDAWDATIPGGVIAEPAIEYYIEARDTGGNLSVAPLSAPSVAYRVAVETPDLAGPTIDLDPVAAPVVEGTPTRIGAFVVDDSGVASLTLYYRSAGTDGWVALPMDAGARNTWSATIPGDAVREPEVAWYVEALDTNDNLSSSPEQADAAPNTFAVEAAPPVDETGPTLVHAPIVEIAQGSALELEVVATDASGVESVRVAYRLEGDGGFTESAMESDDGETFVATVPAGVFTAATFVEYYFVATDSALSNNVAYAPSAAPDETYRVEVLDPGADAGPDAGSDAGPDAGPDAGTDAGPDAGPDAGTDAGTDSGTGVDTGTDAGIGPGSDAGASSDASTIDVGVPSVSQPGGGCAAARPSGTSPLAGALALLALVGLRRRRS
jgi:hypothetical protein